MGGSEALFHCEPHTASCAQWVRARVFHGGAEMEGTLAKLVTGARAHPLFHDRARTSPTMLQFFETWEEYNFDKVSQLLCTIQILRCTASTSAHA